MMNIINFFVVAFILTAATTTARAGALEGTVCMAKEATTSMVLGVAVTRIKCVQEVHGTCADWGYQGVTLPTGYVTQKKVCKRVLHTGVRSNAPADYIRYRPKRTVCHGNPRDFHCRTLPARNEVAEQPRPLAVPAPAVERSVYGGPKPPERCYGIAAYIPPKEDVAEDPTTATAPANLAIKAQLRKEHENLVVQLGAREGELEYLKEQQAGQQAGNSRFLYLQLKIDQTKACMASLGRQIDQKRQEILALE